MFNFYESNSIQIKKYVSLEFTFHLPVIYSGTLTAYIAIPIFDKAINNLEDLLTAAKEDGFSPLLSRGTSNELIFKVKLYYQKK